MTNTYLLTEQSSHISQMQQPRTTINTTVVGIFKTDIKRMNDIRENDDLLMTYGKELFLLSNKAYNDKIDCEEALQKFNNAIISEIKK